MPDAPQRPTPGAAKAVSPDRKSSRAAFRQARGASEGSDPGSALSTQALGAVSGKRTNRS
jgi:hypothetical protein